MKNIFKALLLTALIAPLAVSCVQDDDTELPPYVALLLSEDFNIGADNTILETAGWLNYAETGTAKWKIQQYSSNGYAEFTSYQSGDATNVGWLISPAFTLAEANDKTLVFEVSQSYVTSTANKLEVLISTDFDGTNVTGATWTPLSANLPGTSATYFEFQDSGAIDLSAYSGNVHVAFKVTGSGTNTALDGSYQIDNVNIY